MANLTAIAATGSTAPVVTQAPALPAAAPIQRASHVAPAAASPGGPYVTRGVVYLEENNNSAPAPVTLPKIVNAAPQPSAPTVLAVENPGRAPQPNAQETRGGAYREERTCREERIFPALAPAGVAKNFGAAPQAPAALQAPAAPAPVSGSDARAQQLAQLVSAACPQTRNVKVVFTGSNEITIEMEIRSRDESNAVRDRIYTIRALDPYALVLKFSIP